MCCALCDITKLQISRTACFSIAFYKVKLAKEVEGRLVDGVDAQLAGKGGENL